MSVNNNTVNIGTGIEVYENDISVYLDQYIQERNIEDMRKETQNKWNAALMYIYKYVFKDNRDSLKSPDKDTYNDKLINDICDLYINLCYEYDKEVSINGFSFLTGIHRDTVYKWGSEDRRLGSKCVDVCKKLVDNNEESLSGMLISGGKNPMKILPALNRRHGWNIGQPLTIEDKNAPQKTPEQIAQEYGQPLELSKDQEQGAIIGPATDF